MSARRIVCDLTKRNLSATADIIKAEMSEIESSYKSSVASILEAPGNGFDSTFGALAGADGEAAFKSITCVLPSLTSPCADARGRSAEAKQQLSSMWNSAYSSPALYAKLKAACDTHGGDAERQRLIDVTLRKFEASGAGLVDGPARDTFMENFPQVAAKAAQFEQNINEDLTTALFTEEELAGCDAKFVESLPKDEASGKRVVSIKAPTRVPVMQKATSGETRRRMYMTAAKACVDKNAPLLDELLAVRHRAAASLGFPHHADNVMLFKAAGKEAVASDFVEGMLRRMKGKYESEKAELLAKKRQLEASADEVHAWDISFLSDKIKEERRGIDSEKLKKYFPLQRTLDNILEVYAGLLGLSFVKDATLTKWCDEVLTYRVHDGTGGPLKGYLYFDLFPREGKFGHQMILPLAPTFDGCLPGCCYMGNVSRPEAGQEAMLRLGEVQTMFHELGHMMHAVCTETRYSVLSWAWPMVPWPGGVEQDFLEVPSTMFEQWMLEPEVVTRVASPADGETIDPAVVQKLKETARDLVIVGGTYRYYAMALADLRFHTAGDGVDAKAVYAATIKECLGDELPADTHPAASWYHVAIGYDAGYYGYGWAEVYAQDLFTAFREEGLFNEETGRKLREKILAPCATRPALTMLRDFLGREPNQDAYLHEFGISV